MITSDYDAGRSVYRNLERAGYSSLADAIARRRNVGVLLMLSRDRTKHVSAARKELIAALRDRGLSFPVIGSILNRDHTTIMYAVQTAPQAITAKGQNMSCER